MTTSTSRSAGITLALSGLALAVCFAAAWWSRDLAWFSLSPPGGGAADVAEALRRDLHLTFFTIWASLLLATPALALFPSIRQSARVYQAWRIFWTTVGGIASVGAARAALDAKVVCIKELVGVQPKY